MRRLWVVLAGLLVAGCATVEKAPPPKPRIVPAPPPPAVEAPKIKSDTLKYLAHRHLEPQPTRPLNVRSRCAHRDAVGTVTHLELLVKEAEVKTFKAQVSMKGHGSCRFNLNEFEQVAQMPQALLRKKNDSGCSVRMWEQGRQVTIAFNSCPKSCDGKAFDYLWPIIVDEKNGRCF